MTNHQILNTSNRTLSRVRVGVIDDRGNVQAVITLEELARTGNTQEIWFYNIAGFGCMAFELLVSNADNLINKVEHLRRQRDQ
jgi:hypothetical protein